MSKKTEKELLKRIEELERRVDELEQRPQIVLPNPAPNYTWPTQPTQPPIIWEQPYIGDMPPWDGPIRVTC